MIILINQLLLHGCLEAETLTISKCFSAFGLSPGQTEFAAASLIPHRAVTKWEQVMIFVQMQITEV